MMKVARIQPQFGSIRNNASGNETINGLRNTIILLYI